MTCSARQADAVSPIGDGPGGGNRRGTAVVTGAAGGIGLATAARLATDGHQVWGLDLERGRTRFIEALGPAGARFVAVDVTDERQVHDAVQRAGEGEDLTAVVACAGISGPLARMHLQQAADVRRVFDINLFGVWHTLSAAIPVLSAGSGGSIVVVASVAGLGASPGLGGYGASKAAVLSLVRSAAIENARAGVRINAVCPGPVDTAMVVELEAARGGGDLEHGRRQIQKSIPMGRYATPEQVAGAVAYLVADGSGFVTGTVLPVDGGMRAL
jgi:NAD(P)-dependent dehydrogenase (short-subunit alcohol dehydrogenase family)